MLARVKNKPRTLHLSILCVNNFICVTQQGYDNDITYSLAS